MSIASEITRLQGVKSDILQAISDKGVTVPAGSDLAACPALIAAISGGGIEGTVTIGGKVYPTVAIDDKIWLAKSLDFVWSGLDVGGNPSSNDPVANYYSNDEATYGWDGPYDSGLLYNFPAVEYLTANAASLGIPLGWRVPNTADYDDLLSDVANLGTLLKKGPGNVYGVAWNGISIIPWNALPSGCRGADGIFTAFASFVLFYAANNNYRYGLDATASILKRTEDAKVQCYIRLVKDRA